MRAVVGRAGIGQAGAGVARNESAIAEGRREAGRRVDCAVIHLGHTAVGQGRRQGSRGDGTRHRRDGHRAEAVVGALAAVGGGRYGQAHGAAGADAARGGHVGAVVGQRDRTGVERQAIAADGAADAAAREAGAGRRSRAVIDLGQRPAYCRRRPRHAQWRNAGRHAGAGGSQRVIAGQGSIAAGDAADAQAGYRHCGGADDVRAIVGGAGVGQRGAGVARDQAAETVGRHEGARGGRRAVVGLGHAGIGHGRRQRGRRDGSRYAASGAGKRVVGGQRTVAAGDAGDAQAGNCQRGSAGDVGAIVRCAGVAQRGAGVARRQAAEAVGRREAGRRIGVAIVGLGHAAVGQRGRQRGRVDGQGAVGVGDQVTELV